MAVQTYRIHLVNRIDGEPSLEVREDLESRYRRNVYREQEHGVVLYTGPAQGGAGATFIPWMNITHVKIFKTET